MVVTYVLCQILFTIDKHNKTICTRIIFWGTQLLLESLTDKLMVTKILNKAKQPAQH